MLRELGRKFERDWGWNLARLLAFTCLMAHFAVLVLALSTLWLVLRLGGPHAVRSLVAALFRLLPDQISSTAALCPSAASPRCFRGPRPPRCTCDWLVGRGSWRWGSWSA
jgi:hypothetical protein